MSAGALMLLIKGIDLLVMGIEMAPEIKSLFGGISDSVKNMVKEKRDPTPEEWAMLDAFRDALNKRIEDAI